jgi:hypothetical protein
MGIDVFRKRSEILSARVREDLLVLLERSQAPEDVRGFLLNRWASLLSGIALRKGDDHPDWLAGWDTVHALLWSLSPRQGVADALQLLHLLPLLVERLQDGCQALHLDTAECDPFFANLAMLHAAIVRGAMQSDAVPPKLSEHFELGGSVTLSRFISEDQPDRSSDTASGNGSDDIDQVVGALTPGAKIRLFEPGASGKVMTLQWISPMRGMFLFTDAHGGDAVSLTRAKLKEKLIRHEAEWLSA